MMKRILSKRGFLQGFWGNAVAGIFAMFFIAIILFALVLAGAQMKSSTTDTAAIGVINNFTNGISQFTSFSGTIWIMLAIGLVIGIVIAAVFVYMRNQ